MESDLDHVPTARPVHLTAATTSAVVLGISLATLAPGLTFIDSGELAAVVHTFGIAHPTGYPLFTLLSGLWAELPLGSPIWRLNLLSAVWTALAAGVLVELIFTLTSVPPRPPGGSSRQQQRRAKRRDRRSAPGTRDEALAVPLRLVAAAFGAALICLSRTAWSLALSVEVYPLHLFLASLVMLASVRALPEGSAEPDRRWLALLALFLGLAFSNHMTTIYLVPGVVVGYLWHQGLGADAWRRASRVAPLFVAGLLPYLYLPLRAAAGPALCWGDPTSLERFLWHISGKQYRGWIFSSTEAAGRQFRHFLSIYPGEFAWIGLVLAPVGLWWLWRHRRRTAVMLLLWFVVAVAYSINYDIHDIDSYFLLALVVTGVCSALGLAALLRSERWRTTAVAGAAVTVLVMVAVNGPRVSERGNHLVGDYARNILESLDENAVILSFQWDYWLSASYYLQLVEGLRPDVVVIDTELVRRSHYLTQMGRNHPEVWPVDSPALTAFTVELDKFEHGRPYDPEVIDRAYYHFLNTIVESNHQAGRPVYVTLEIGPEIGPDFVRIPEGLAFRLYREWDLASADRPVDMDFRYRPFDRHNHLTDAIVDAYASAYTNRGLFYLTLGRPEQALPLADRALQIEPGLDDAIRLRERCLEAAGR